MEKEIRGESEKKIFLSALQKQFLRYSTFKNEHETICLSNEQAVPSFISLNQNILLHNWDVCRCLIESC